MSASGVGNLSASVEFKCEYGVNSGRYSWSVEDNNKLEISLFLPNEELKMENPAFKQGIENFHIIPKRNQLDSNYEFLSSIIQAKVNRLISGLEKNLKALLQHSFFRFCCI